jgi:hypothetical protein
VICARCLTAVSYYGDAGWRHDVHFNLRNHCTVVDPMEESANADHHPTGTT